MQSRIFQPLFQSNSYGRNLENIRFTTAAASAISKKTAFAGLCGSGRHGKNTHEEGSPAELKKAGGIYKHMADIQLCSEQWKYK